MNQMLNLVIEKCDAQSRAEPVTVRPLVPCDAAAVFEHWRALPPKDQRWRFEGLHSAALLSQMAQELVEAHDVITAGALDSDRLIGVASGHCCGPAAIEVAVSVDVLYRRQGIGASLLRFVHASAGRLGREVGVFEMDPMNWPMLRLLARVGGAFDREEQRGVVAL